MRNKEDCLVILSGGQDSTTCALIASGQFKRVHAITFDYGQRHRIEIESARAIASALSVASHEIIPVGSILRGTSPLVNPDNPVGEYESAESLPGGVEPTFVPGRNMLFLTIAANRAVALGINQIFLGVCQADYGGYWDCREQFVDLAAIVLGLGISGSSYQFEVIAPLMNLTKAQSVAVAKELAGDKFDHLFGLTHTCYQGVRGGCGKCHACILRDKGFNEAGVTDPLWKLRAVTA